MKFSIDAAEDVTFVLRPVNMGVQSYENRSYGRGWRGASGGVVVVIRHGVA